MPETPDPDPLTKVIGMLRAAVDDLARLVEHPTVKNAVDGLIGALTPTGRPQPPAAPGPPPDPDPSEPSERSERSRPATATPPPTTTARSGGRRDQLLAVIRARPGVTIPAAAAEIGVSPSGLYRVARRLEADGLVRKEASGWHPAG